MYRGELTNEQWERLKPWLPPQKPYTGRPARDHRCIINGILWIIRTGALWRDLPEHYGPWQTVASRFYRWRRRASGMPCLPWCRNRLTLLARSIGPSTLSTAPSCVPTSTRQVQKGGLEAEALGYSRGGFSTKVHRALRATENP